MNAWYASALRIAEIASSCSSRDATHASEPPPAAHVRSHSKAVISSQGGTNRHFPLDPAHSQSSGFFQQDVDASELPRQKRTAHTRTLNGGMTCGPQTCLCDSQSFRFFGSGNCRKSLPKLLKNECTCFEASAAFLWRLFCSILPFSRTTSRPVTQAYPSQYPASVVEKAACKRQH